MTEFEALYAQKKGTLNDCLKAIHSHARVCFAGDGNQPNTVLEHLHEIAPSVDDVHCIKGHEGNFQCVTDPAMNGHISFTTFLYGRTLMEGQKNRNVSFVPSDICDYGSFMAQYRPRNVFVAAVSPMDERGYFCVGLTNMWESDCFPTCDTIILEVNPRVWGSFPLTACANSPFALRYAEAASGTLRNNPLCDYETGVRMRFLLNDALATLQLLGRGRLREGFAGIGDLFRAREALADRDDPGPLRAYVRAAFRGVL